MSRRTASFGNRSHLRRARWKQMRRLFFEGLESRQLLSADLALGESPWRNHDQPLDTNNDHSVTPLDFLVVVNAIHAKESRQADDPDSEIFGAGESGVYPDINGDHVITAIDALALANWFLNSAPDIMDELAGLPAASPMDLAATTSSGSTPDDSASADEADEGEAGEVVCDTPPVTISAPSDVNEFSIFTVSGTAKYAESIDISATGIWAYVDIVGSTRGSSFDAETGAFTQMLIFKDDSPAGTSEDLETVTVVVTGACGGSASADVMVHNVDVQASVSVEPAEINEGESVGLTVNFSDAVVDGQTIIVDWGDGQTSTIRYPDQVPNPPEVRERIAFIEPPGRLTFTESFSHQYLDDNPTATPADDYVVTVKVSDNDLSLATITTLVTVNNVAPTIVIDGVFPLDNEIKNDQIDETEGFRVKGVVTDPGILDTHSGTVKADLNWDGDFDDLGEKLDISGGGGSWAFNVIFPVVPDDGPSPGNHTPADALKVIVEVVDDDTGRALKSRDADIVNFVPRVFWDFVTLTYTRDASGNIDTVTITGGFEDIGQSDVHELGVKWGDGGAGDGMKNPLPITGRTFSVTRRFPPGFGTSIRRIFPIKMGVRDDDKGVDTGQLDGTTHWSFGAAPLALDTRDLIPKLVEPFISPAHAGAKWKGYGEALIAEVQEDSNAIIGSADAASALAFPSLFSSPDFTQDLQFRASSTLNFIITCDRETGDIGKEVSGGGGGNAIKLTSDGKFMGWDPTAQSVQQYGPLGASTNVQIGVTPGAGATTVELNVESHFGYSTNVTIVSENGPQIERPGGRIVIKLGTSSTYPGGLHDFARTVKTYTCREKLQLIRTDLED